MKWYEDLFVGESVTGKIKKIKLSEDITVIYNGKNYPITDQNKLEETSISLAMAVRCVKYSASDLEDDDPSKLPIEDMDQVLDGNEW